MSITRHSTTKSTSKTPRKILIVDDHPIVRTGLRTYLANHCESTVVAEASNAVEALLQARQLSPDLVLMDIVLPEVDGFKLTSTLQKELPHVKIILLSALNSTEYAEQILASGASGYISKASPPSDYLKAIDIVWEEGKFFSPEIIRAAANHTSPLDAITPREREVLVGVAEGLPNKGIADRLGVGVRTIETHRERIMRKLNIRTIAGLTKFALVNNLISLNADN
ncbi:MAG: DNA-binding response regulator [Verrucomicrobia bacterium]|nr:MAG: DNA-binding response regulator [Verrucomicrobiota bacterium]